MLRSGVEGVKTKSLDCGLILNELSGEIEALSWIRSLKSKEEYIVIV